MLSVLPESRRVRRRAITSVVISAAVHVGIIAAAVDARTAEPPRVQANLPDSLVYFQPPRPVDPGPKERVARVPVPPQQPVAPIPPLPQAPPEPMPFVIPDTLPSVDTRLGDVFARDSARVNVIAERTGSGQAGAGADETLPNAYADKPALALPDNPAPRYPEMLRTAGVIGSVTMRFVIDSLGRASPRTAEVLRTDHALFTAAVLAVLPRMRFIPAEANGRRVRVLAEQRFEFRLAP